MGSWSRLAAAAAFRKGNAFYCGHINPVTPGMWSGGAVGLKAILGIKNRQKALNTLRDLEELGYLNVAFDGQTKQLSYQISDWVLKCSGSECMAGSVYATEGYLEMPIYLGATYTHMAEGAARLSQTSIPIGGDNTNCIVAGHRGWGGAKYFRYITDLVPGDTVKITNLWETMTYTICETQIIDPDDVEAIHIRPGRELLTLLTCHPYATGGRQRYLVVCERNYDESDSRLPG